MDLFSQLDRVESQSSGQQTVVVRYRTRFHRDIIYANLATNPSLSQDDVAAAVAVNEPELFLPQPWPPQALENDVSISIVALTKMKAVVNVGLGLPHAQEELLSNLVTRRFPERAVMETTSTAITSCETRITRDGTVTSSFGFPRTPQFKSGDVASLNNARLYAKAMLVLGLQRQLDQLG